MTTIILLICFIPGFLFAQDEISGPLMGTIGPGTYIVVGDLEVPSGETLTIAAGTTFLFSEHYYFFVEGLLIAMGSESDSIVFTRQLPTEACRWGGIRFMAGASNGNILSYCLIDNCKNYSYPYFFGGGLASDGVSVDVLNSTVQFCEASDGGAFYGLDGGQVNFIDCVISNNYAGNGGGLFYDQGSSGEIRGCQIVNNTSTST